MKILLFGDFSSVHYNLKYGLTELGHQCLLVSSGDGYKSIPSDISLNYNSSSLLGHLFGRIKPFTYLPRFIGFDIVQLISPYYLMTLPYK